MKSSSSGAKACNVSLAVGILCSAICLIVMNMFGDPYETIHKIDPSDTIPPVWLWKLSFTVWFFLIGFASGNVINTSSCQKLSTESKFRAYRGGLCFISAFFLSLFHFPLFFISAKLLVALLTAMLSAALSIICGLLWSRVEKTASLTMLAYSCWLFYVIFVNLRVFFKI